MVLDERQKKITTKKNFFYAQFISIRKMVELKIITT